MIQSSAITVANSVKTMRKKIILRCAKLKIVLDIFSREIQTTRIKYR